MSATSYNPFIQAGGTSVLSVTATATATPILLSGYEDLSLYNSGAVAVFLSLNSVSATAKSGAVIPTVGTPQNVIVIPPGQEKVISAAPDCYAAAIGAGAGPSLLYITPGRGI
jgi:hypothetical protein